MWSFWVVTNHGFCFVNLGDHFNNLTTSGYHAINDSSDYEVWTSPTIFGHLSYRYDKGANQWVGYLRRDSDKMEERFIHQVTSLEVLVVCGSFPPGYNTIE